MLSAKVKKNEVSIVIHNVKAIKLGVYVSGKQNFKVGVKLHIMLCAEEK